MFIGESVNITENISIVDVDFVDIAISRNGGSLWSSIATNVPVSHSKIDDQEIYSPLIYNWLVSGSVSSNCIIRITGVAPDNDIVFLSEVFTIEYNTLIVNAQTSNFTSSIVITNNLEDIAISVEASIIEFISIATMTIGINLITPAIRTLQIRPSQLSVEPYPHNNNSKLDYQISVDNLWLDSDTIQSVNVSPNTSLLIEVIQVTNRSIQFWISGSSLIEGSIYKAVFNVNSSFGRNEIIIFPIIVRKIP